MTNEESWEVRETERERETSENRCPAYIDLLGGFFIKKSPNRRVIICLGTTSVCVFYSFSWIILTLNYQQ